MRPPGWSSVPQRTRPASSPPRAATLPLRLAGDCFPTPGGVGLGIFESHYVTTEWCSRPLIDGPAGPFRMSANELRGRRTHQRRDRPGFTDPGRGTKHDGGRRARQGCVGAGIVSGIQRAPARVGARGLSRKLLRTGRWLTGEQSDPETLSTLTRVAGGFLGV